MDETTDPKFAPVSYRYNLDSPDEYVATAEEIANGGRVDEAIDVLREGSLRFSESARTHYDLGAAIIWRLKEDYAHLEIWEDLAGQEALAEEAIAELQLAIDRDPNMTDAYNSLASLYALRGRRSDAIATWEKSLQINADQPDIQADLDLYRSKLSAAPETIEGEPEEEIDTKY
jgi:tetratricopeptide (TPR) repeat protein